MTMLEQYKAAKERYAALGVDTDKALERLRKISLSLHCWQTDDVGGFESEDAELSGGGIQVTGNYPGKARSISEMRSDLDKVYSLLPGKHRLALHGIYGEFEGKKIDRDAIEPEHFNGWMKWSKDNDIKLDFNGSYFSHPLAESGFTLSHPDKSIREFWIEHGKRSRQISAAMGQVQKDPCIHNTWIPDGAKDLPVNRLKYRTILKEALDEMYSESISSKEMKDAVETKLFGIGSESYVVGSHEFYMGYAAKNNKIITIDLGHFHPTELIADKLSSLYLFFDELLLHVSRPVRWDSDHVVILNDDLRYLTEEIIRCDRLEKTHIGLDFFDATMNRIGAYAIGARATLKGLLLGLLEPSGILNRYNEENNAFARLALIEELKMMPVGDIWNYYCETSNVSADKYLIDDVMQYEKEVLSRRG
jgi:L-rhamnose isomerase